MRKAVVAMTMACALGVSGGSASAEPCAPATSICVEGVEGIVESAQQTVAETRTLAEARVSQAVEEADKAATVVFGAVGDVNRAATAAVEQAGGVGNQVYGQVLVGTVWPTVRTAEEQNAICAPGTPLCATGVGTQIYNTEMTACSNGASTLVFYTRGGC